MAQQQPPTISCEALGFDLPRAQSILSEHRDTIQSYWGKVNSGGSLTRDEMVNLADITCRIKRTLVMANAYSAPSQCFRKQLDQMVKDLRAQDATASALEERLALPGGMRRCRPVTLPDGTQGPVSQKSPAATETVAAPARQTMPNHRLYHGMAPITVGGGIGP